MIEIIALIAAVILARTSGAMVRGAEHAAPLRLLGWIVCAAGMWLLAGAAGAWFPIWPALLLGAGAGLAHLLIRQNQPLMAVTDASVILLCGALSIPAIGFEVLIATVAFGVVVGFALDQLPRVAPRRIRLAAFGVPVLLAVAGAIVMDRAAFGGEAGAWYRASPVAAANIAITRPLKAQRIELSSDSGTAVAWLERPRGPIEGGPHPGAVVFHGNHRAGSHQPAASALRRALLQAGYVVLSLDHPGYGETPPPGDLADVDSWNPAPHVAAAIARLRAEPNVGSIIAIGHSMGCLDVLRTFADAAPPDAAIVFGMGVFDPPPSDERWVRGFVSARALPQDSIDVGTGAAIRARYYEMEQLLDEVGERKPPLLFVRFGMEHENLVIGREQALELFHKRPIVWDLDESTHYFSASERFGIIFGDVRVTRALAQRLREMRPAPAAIARLEH